MWSALEVKKANGINKNVFMITNLWGRGGQARERKGRRERRWGNSLGQQRGSDQDWPSRQWSGGSRDNPLGLSRLLSSESVLPYKLFTTNSVFWVP